MQFDDLIPKQSQNKKPSGIGFEDLIPKEQEVNPVVDALLNKTPAGLLAQRTAKRTALSEPINERHAAMVAHRGRGFKQLIMKAGKEAGLVSQKDFDDYTKSAVDKREKFEQDFAKKYGDSDFWEQIDFEADVGTSLALPGIGKGRLARILFGALAGGTESGSRLTEDEQEIADNFLSGSMFGGGGSAVIEAFNSLRPTNLMRRAYDKFKGRGGEDIPTAQIPKQKLEFGGGYDGKQSREVKAGVLDQGLKSENIVGGNLSLAELTQDPWFESLEAFVRSDPDIESASRILTNKQISRSYKWFKKQANNLDPSNKYFATQMQTDFSATLKELTKARKHRATKDFYKAFNSDPNSKIDVRNVKSIIQEEINALSSPGVAVGKKLTQLNQLKKLKDGLPDNIDAKHAQSLYETWTPGAGVESKVFKEIDKSAESRILKRLVGELDNSVTNTSDQLLIQARNNYKNNSAPIEELKNSAVGKLFNTQNPSQEQILSAFDKMTSSDIKATISILKNKDPEIINRIRSFKINQAINTGSKTQDPSQFQFDLPAFQKKLKDDPTFKTVFTGKERSDLLKGLNYTNRIAKTIRKMSSTQALEVGGAGVNKTILAKMLSRMGGSMAFGEMMMTEEGLKLIKQAATTTNTVAFSAALNDVIEYMGMSPNELKEGISND